MNRLSSDLRYGLRMLLKTPGATATVLIALSLGIGLSALTFSLIQGAVLTSLPFEGGDRIVRIGRVGAPVTLEDYATWSAREMSFDALGAVEMATVALAIEGAGTAPVSSAAITPSILPLLSAEPALGRTFTGGDAAPGAPVVVLVSHDVWRGRLGSDPEVLGRTVRVNGRPARIVGVMPEDFAFPWDQQVWTPLDMDPVRRDRGEPTASSEGRLVVGRLREGVTEQAAARELTAMTRELDGGARRAAGPGATVRVANYTDLFGESGRSLALAGLMLGVAFLVLLVACANVANVLLARAVDRRREVAVRLAIGAPRLRIVAQLLTEISLLAAAGAAGGVLVALIGTRFVEAAVPPGMPFWVGFRMDPAVLGFVAVLAVLATLTAGLMPALQASRSGAEDLRDATRGSSGLRIGRVMRRLVGVEMALSFVLLVLAGLFIKSAVNFQATAFAFEPEGVYTAGIQLPRTTYDDAAALAAVSGEVRQTLRALPHVADVALATAVPGVGSSAVVSFGVEGAALLNGEADARARSIVVSPGYFEVFRTPLVAGRGFDARDLTGSPPVAIVNEAFARAHFPEGALDRRIRLAGGKGKEPWRMIVGVTPDLMEGGVEGDVQEAVYLPLAQHPQPVLRILARPRGDFASLPAPVREAVATLDQDIALFRVLPLDVVIDRANSQYKWFSFIFLISGGIALFLSAIGLYGVMAFWVVQRTREIGVRMALGGQRRDIIRLVLGQGMAQTSLGLIVGVLLALPAARLLNTGLYGVASYDPTVFASIIAVLSGAAWLGCWLPARRATRMDPVQALAAE